MSLLSLIKRVTTGRRLTALEHDQNLTRIENAVNNPDVQIRRVLITFDQYSTLEEAQSSLGLALGLHGGVGGTFDLVSPEGPGPVMDSFYWEAMGNPGKMLRYKQQAPNGSAVHTGDSNGFDIYLDGFNAASPALTPLDLQPGDSVTVNFTFCPMAENQYAAADAGEYIYPGVMYNQRDDWRSSCPRFWVGDYASAYGMPQQQLQYSAFFGACAWDYCPMTAGYEWTMGEYSNSDGFGAQAVGPVPTMTMFNLWRENQLFVYISSIEIISRRGTTQPPTP